MSKRKHSPTSKAAYEQAKQMMEDHHKKIISSLQRLGRANYETIAAHCGLERHQVGRRMSELEGKQIVYKPGTTSKTRSGRQSFDWCLTESYSLKVDHPVKQLTDKTKEAKQFLNTLFP